MNKIDTRIKPAPQPASPPAPSMREVRDAYDAGLKKTIRAEDGNFEIEIPCPCCAQAAMIKTDLIPEDGNRSAHSTTCTGCKRFFTLLIEQKKNGALDYEVTKMSGPDAPKWFSAAMRKGTL